MLRHLKLAASTALSRQRSRALMAAIMLPLMMTSAVQAQQGESCENDAQQTVAQYNYILGTQAIGGSYQFTQDAAVLEQAREVEGLGSNLLKISLAGGAAEKYGTADAARNAGTTLAYILASPQMQQALDMDFAYYQAWVHSFTGGDWRDGVSPREERAYYDEMYELAAWLLTRYAGTGKTFMLGNWEGDWLLTGRGNRAAVPSMQAVDGMTDWLNIRQRAIDDAKAAVGHDGVELYHYVEVNLVRKAMEGDRSIAHSILPKTNVDLVSYSSYEAIKRSQKPDIESIRQPLTQIMDYLEGQLPHKEGLPFERRVFIGEYGYHANNARPQSVMQQYLKSRYVMEVSVALDLPFALIWQMYNNEYAPDGTSKQMSLINEAGERRALYYLHRHYLSNMREFVAESCRATGNVPTREAFKARALDVLQIASFEDMQQLAQEGL